MSACSATAAWETRDSPISRPTLSTSRDSALTPIFDTGPLVAYLDRSETHHPWMAARAGELPLPWLVCEPVLAESWYLLRMAGPAQDALLGMLADGLLRIEFDLGREINGVRQLCLKYGDLPMSLADACVVRMAEMGAGRLVCTLDRHFSVYRLRGGEPISLIAPFTG